MNRRPLSPIEIMIDRACGVTVNVSAPSRITLRCPACKVEKSVVRTLLDPTDASVVVFPCPKCFVAETATIEYFDAGGKAL